MNHTIPRADPIRRGFYYILIILGIIWLRSIYGKAAGGTFVTTLDATLGRFASDNPYPFMQFFLTTIAIPNSQLFAILTMIGEGFTAITLLCAPILMIRNKQATGLLRKILIGGLITGTALNVVFFLASGWMSPASWSLNVTMAMIQIIASISLYQDAKPAGDVKIS